jgi:NAD(P)-dependent dehydrogenase (short-subunit alcohol dehydrogenase family)
VAHTAKYDEDMFDAVIGVNVKGVFLGLRHVLPVMLQQKRGAIVNTAWAPGDPRNARLCRLKARGDRTDQGRRR